MISEILRRKGGILSLGEGVFDDAIKNRLQTVKFIGNMIAATVFFCVQLFTNIRAAVRSAANKNPVIFAREAARKGHVKRSERRGKIHTPTSTLIHHEEDAFGHAAKHGDIIQDIDASNVGNPLAVVDYVEDLYQFYKYNECSNPPLDYIHLQLNISEKMRAAVANWILRIHHKYSLRPETLYLTFNIIDRYLTLTKVRDIYELILIGASSLRIASKYEETHAPKVDDITYITNEAYTREEILAMEAEILSSLQLMLTVPTQYVFLVRFIQAARCDKEMEHMAFFFAELGLTQYSMVKYSPSLAASSAVYAALWTLRKMPYWTETLRYHTGFTEMQLWECANILIKCHLGGSEKSLRLSMRNIQARNMKLWHCIRQENYYKTTWPDN